MLGWFGSKDWFFITDVADLLRGDYKQSDYGKGTLPFSVLRRLYCLLKASTAAA